MPTRVPACCDNSIFLSLVPHAAVTLSCTYKYDEYGCVWVGARKRGPGCREAAVPQRRAPMGASPAARALGGAHGQGQGGHASAGGGRRWRKKQMRGGSAVLRPSLCVSERRADLDNEEPRRLELRYRFDVALQNTSNANPPFIAQSILYIHIFFSTRPFFLVRLFLEKMKAAEGAKPVKRSV